MDKLVRKIEIPLARRAIERAGLYIAEKKDFDRLAEVAADAYRDYPLHNWFTKGKYDSVASQQDGQDLFFVRYKVQLALLPFGRAEFLFFLLIYP